MKKQYTIAATSMYGTFIAGEYIADTKRKALKMAEEEHGEQTYYVFKERKIGLNGKNYFIARYCNDLDDQLDFDSYWENQIKFGTEQDAEKDLKRLLKNTDYKDWQIFWIESQKDRTKSPEYTRAQIEEEGKRLEELKKTNYEAWLQIKNDT